MFLVLAYAKSIYLQTLLSSHRLCLNINYLDECKHRNNKHTESIAEAIQATQRHQQIQICNYYVAALFMHVDRLIGGILFLSCLFVCLFVCLSIVNFKLCYNF